MDEQTAVFEDVLPKLTTEDLKYIIRLIKGDLKMQAGSKFLLDALHPDAYQAFQVSHDLKAVIDAVLQNSDLSQLTQSLDQSISSVRDDDDNNNNNNNSDGDDDEREKKREKKDKKEAKRKARLVFIWP